MAKKLAILWDIRFGANADYDERVRLLSERLGKGYSVRREALRDLEFWFDGNTMDIYNEQGVSLGDVDAVYFARWRAYQNALAVAVYCDHHDIAYKTSEVRRFPAMNKLGEHALMYDGGITLPRTIITSVRNLREHAHKYLEFIGEPAVLKRVDASFGNDNFLIEKYTDLQVSLQTYTEKDIFVLQQFIPNEHDYRVLVFNAKATVVLRRSRTDSSHHLNNTKKGGKGDIVPLDADMAALAEKAAASVGRSDLAGVDIIRDKTTGALYVLEVNKMPVIISYPLREEKVDALVEFVRSI